jgi:hypothetical protein
VFVLRCTKKLLQRVEPSGRSKSEPPKSTTRLGDWYANLLIIRRQQLVLAVSSISLLPVLLPAAPFKTVPARLTRAVGEVLDALSVDRQMIASEVAAMSECGVAATNSRQVLGTMTEFTYMLGAYLDSRTLTDVAIHLAETPCKPLRWESPRSATAVVFAGPGLRLVKG